MAELEKHGLDRDTVVFFTSDNGGVGSYKAMGIDNNEVTSNEPLKGGKGTLYEGGVRVPFIFRWTGKIEAGATTEQPIISTDIYPTMLELTGGSAPENQPLDGVSIVSLLTDKKPLAERELYWHFPGYLGGRGDSWRTAPVGAIRSGDYKLLEFFEDGKLELYNLKDDPGQQKNLATDQADRAKSLQEKLAGWREEIGAKMPTPITEQDKAEAKKGARKRKRGAAAEEE